MLTQALACPCRPLLASHSYSLIITHAHSLFRPRPRSAISRSRSHPRPLSLFLPLIHALSTHSLLHSRAFSFKTRTQWLSLSPREPRDHHMLASHRARAALGDRPGTFAVPFGTIFSSTHSYPATNSGGEAKPSEAAVKVTAQHHSKRQTRGRPLTCRKLCSPDRCPTPQTAVRNDVGGSSQGERACGDVGASAPKSPTITEC